MPGGTINKCTGCGKLIIFGQTCECGHRTNTVQVRKPRKGKNKR